MVFFYQKCLDFSGMNVVRCLTTELLFMQFIIDFIKRSQDIDKVQDRNVLKGSNVTLEHRVTLGNEEWVFKS